mgnify:CR=1 FL=1
MKEQDQTNQPQEKKKRAAKPNFGLFLGNNGAAAGKPQGGAESEQTAAGASCGNGGQASRSSARRAPQRQ